MPILFLNVFSLMAAFAVLLPSIMYVLINLGADKALATQILASYSIAQFLAAPMLGSLSDKVGRKTTLQLGLGLAVVSYAYLAFMSHTLLQALGGLALAGCAAGAVSVAFAGVSDITSEDNRAKGMGALGAAIGAAFTLGPAIGAVLSSHSAQAANLTAPATASTIIVAIGFLATFKLPDSLNQTRGGHTDSLITRLVGLRYIWGRKTLFNIALMMFVLTLALALMEPITPFLVQDRYAWGPREMGYIFGLAGLTSIIVQGGLVGRLTKRFGERRLLVSGLVFMGVGLVCLWLAPTAAFVPVAFLCTSIGGALFNTSVFALTSKMAEEHERGRIMGTVQSMQALGRSSGPMLAGTLYQTTAGLPLIVGAVAMVISIMWARLIKLWP